MTAFEHARSLTLVVPAYNERTRLPALLEALPEAAAGPFAAAGFRLAETIVVDDGSTDGTAELVTPADRPYALRALRLPENRGKGAAVRAGMLAAESPFALLADADLATPFTEIVSLAAKLDEGFDIAIGSRGLPESDIVVHQPAYRELMGKTFNLGIRLLTGLPFRDTQCGFKLFRMAAARPLFELQRTDGFAYDVELLVLARRLGLRVVEVPVRWINHPETTVKLIRSSSRMALDLLRIARVARLPLSSSVASARDRASAARPT